MQRFAVLQIKFVLMVMLAVIVWLSRDFVASFAAREMMTTTTLRTTEERDDARAIRAFHSARQTLRVDAKLETEPNPQQQTRDSRLTFTAPSKREVLEVREAIVREIRTAFAREGPGELYDIGNAPHATPVPNETMNTLKQACNGLALALLLTSFVTLIAQWKRSHLPKAALFGILATALTLVCVMLEGEGIPLGVVLLGVGLPGAFLALIIHVTLKVRKAATWVEGRARITRSEIEAVRHRFAGDTTQVRNKAAVAYEFVADSKTVSGDKITVGIAPADRVDETVKRYPVGAEVPVFYDPANPDDCVLERKPPVSLGCLWTGALVVLLVYFMGFVWLQTGWSPGVMLGKHFPTLHHPLIVIAAGALGLLSLAAGIWNRLHPTKAVPWTRTEGVIVSSAVESYQESDSSSSHHMRTYYKPVIEFRYEVDGKTYHAIEGQADLVKITIGRGQASAEAEAARYPAGMKLDVYYDPANPTRASLRENAGIALTGTPSFIVAVLLLAVAVYAARH